MQRVGLQNEVLCRQSICFVGAAAPSLRLSRIFGTSLGLAAGLLSTAPWAAAQAATMLPPPPAAAADPLPGSPWEVRSPDTGFQRPQEAAKSLIRQPDRRLNERHTDSGPGKLPMEADPATVRPQRDGERIDPQPLPMPLDLGALPAPPESRLGASALVSSREAWQGLPWWGLAIDDPAESLLGVESGLEQSRIATAPPNDVSWSLTQDTGSRAPSTALLGPATVTPPPDQGIPVGTLDWTPQSSANRYWTTAIDRQQAKDLQRSQVSAQLSHRILAPPQASEQLPAMPADWTGLGAASGWQAVGQELAARLSACHQLLQRGAVLSARQEAVMGVERLIASLDNRIGKRVTEQHWRQAMTALNEQREFLEASGLAKLSTRELVGRHQTPLLKNKQVDDLPGGRAAAYYRAYAEEQLISAGAGHPWMADLLYALGRTYEHEARLEAEQRSAEPGLLVACSFYQAAIGLAPGQSLAATQLGRLLMELDRTAEAEQVLVGGLQAGPSAAGWETLAEVYRRQGNQAGQRWAQGQLARWPAGPSHAPTRHIHTVEPEQFAKLSPPLGPAAHAKSSAELGHPGVPPRGGPAAVPASWAAPGGISGQRR